MSDNPEVRPRGTYGDGTVRTRKDGLLEKRVRLGVDARGKYIRKSVYGKTLREVQRKARQAINAHQAAQRQHSPENAELSSFFEQWLDRKALEVEPRTVRNYQREYAAYIEPHLATVPVNPAKLTIDLLLSWHSGLARAHGAHTANRARNLLRNALRDAVARGMLPSNPAQAISAARHERAPIEILNAEQLAVFLQESQRSRLQHMFHLALATGLRHGEATALHWNRVKIYKQLDESGNAGELRVDQAVVIDEAEQRIISKPKRGTVRTILLTADAAAALMAQREMLKAEGQADARLVFPNSLGGLQDDTNTARALKGVLDACNPRLRDWMLERRRVLRDRGLNAGTAARRAWQEAKALPEFRDLLDVPYVSFHDLRHTFASIMIAAGMDAVRLSRLLGHSDPAFTMRTYAHLFEGREKHAMPSMMEFVEIGGKIGGSSE